MVLGFDGKALVLGVEGEALGDGPGLEDAINFEPDVIVQPRGIVLLDDKAWVFGGGDLRGSPRPRRLVLLCVNDQPPCSVSDVPSACESRCASDPAVQDSTVATVVRRACASFMTRAT